MVKRPGILGEKEDKLRVEKAGSRRGKGRWVDSILVDCGSIKLVCSLLR